MSEGLESALRLSSSACEEPVRDEINALVRLRGYIYIPNIRNNKCALWDDPVSVVIRFCCLVVETYGQKSSLVLKSYFSSFKLTLGENGIDTSQILRS